MESEIEHRSAFRQFEQVPFGSKYENLIFVKVHFELVHHFHRVVVRIFQCFANRSQPFVQTSFAFDAFVSPVSSQSALSDFVHAAGTYLYFHPFSFRSHHSDVQRLVTIAFRDRKPVTQTLRVRLVHIGHNGIYLPTFLLLLCRFRFRIQNNTDGKQVVNPFERCFLFLNLVPYRMYGLGTSLDVEFQSRSRHLFLYRFNKSGDILVA
ncbi:hypothetical protein IMSAGC001_04174 [Bacteroides acidifaciens]|uniref:Uncharacterized protein n=1 Tax=Bacteroides acidifaciens TaxID=85831 RepID=A0A7J0A9U0_9BACE|nr:hypothetical protein IMSAGC001_04174 [Bacteroides acidifaciens]